MASPRPRPGSAEIPEITEGLSHISLFDESTNHYNDGNTRLLKRLCCASDPPARLQTSASATPAVFVPFTNSDIDQSDDEMKRLTLSNAALHFIRSEDRPSAPLPYLPIPEDDGMEFLSTHEPLMRPPASRPVKRGYDASRISDRRTPVRLSRLVDCFCRLKTHL